MAFLTTGLIDNPAVSGIRPTSTLTVRITNDDTVSASIQIMGFYLMGATKTQYVLEFFTLPPGGVATKNYFAQFDAFEFQFINSSDAVEVTAWGKNAAGNLTTAHRIVAEEMNAIGPTAGLSAFGYVYDLATGSNATVTGGFDVPFSNNGPLSNISHAAGTTAVTVATTGNYQIDYSVNIALGVGSTLAIAVGGTVDPSTPISTLLFTGVVSGQAILPLTAGDAVTLRNSSGIPITLDLAPNVGAQMTVEKLD